MLAASSRARLGASAALRKAMLLNTKAAATVPRLPAVAPCAAFASHSKRGLSSQGANLQKASQSDCLARV